MKKIPSSAKVVVIGGAHAGVEAACASARMGAKVTGIDASEKNTVTAQVHAAESGLNIHYKATTVEELAAVGEIFDAVISLEVVEHVANFELFIKGCAELMGANSAILIATLNRTPKSFAFGIIGAEYILRWLPRGTHNWRKFIRPSELTSALRRNRVVTEEIAGFVFQSVH